MDKKGMMAPTMSDFKRQLLQIYSDDSSTYDGSKTILS